MRIDVRGDKLVVTDAIKKALEEKVGKLNSYFANPEELKAYVVIRVKNKDQKVEVTIPTPKFTLRAETTHEDLYGAINLTVDKLERQIRKNKTKLRKRFKNILQEEIEDINEEDNKIVKRKEITLKPMDEEEAILQMELLGHEFYMYKDSDTNEPAVVYKRKDSNYGLIESE